MRNRHDPNRQQRHLQKTARLDERQMTFAQKRAAERVARRSRHLAMLERYGKLGRNGLPL